MVGFLILDCVRTITLQIILKEVGFMLNILVSVLVSCLIVPTMTYFLNKCFHKAVKSEADTLDAISKLKSDVRSADSGLAIISRDICAFVTSGTDLIDDNTRYFSLNKLQLERDWETYGYHFKNQTINCLMNKLLDELKSTDDSVKNIKLLGKTPSYTFYDSERPEVKELCSLINAERRKIIK